MGNLGQPLAQVALLTGALIEQLRTEACRGWPRLIANYLEQLIRADLTNGDVVFTLLVLVAGEIRRLTGDRACPIGDPLEHLLATWEKDRPPREALTAFRETLQRHTDPDACEHQSCSARILELRRFIDTHYAEPLTLKDLAREIRLQKNYAATLFREETGVTLHRYLTQVRVQHAAARLRDGEKVEAVMLLVGYRSKKSFYHQFRAILGVTPGAYRRSLPLHARAS